MTYGTGLNLVCGLDRLVFQVYSALLFTAVQALFKCIQCIEYC